MAADQQFCLRWNNHQSTLISVFDTLLESETLVDCTLAAEGQYLKAHKVVLSACSPYLEVLLSQHYEKHPIVILKDVKFQELKSMMDYMYRGEVNISQDQLGTFLKAAESLQIKGLSDGGGGENDSRDVGSTPVTSKRHDPPRKVPPSVPPVPQPRNPLLPHSQSNSGLSIEPRRPVPQHISDSAPESPSHRSREGSISPSLRKRRRTRRPSQGDDSNLDSHLDTSNSCDVPSQAQSTPMSAGIVPSIPASMTPLVPPSSTITKAPPIETEQNLQTDTLNRLDNSNSLPPESGLIKEKIEPTNEGLLEPKTEYMDDINNEDSVEDLTLDDDDEMEEMGMARPGPSHGGDGSNQGFAPWHMTGNQSGTDEVFMAAQEAVGAAHRDSQGKNIKVREEDDIRILEVFGNVTGENSGSVEEIHVECNLEIMEGNSSSEGIDNNTTEDISMGGSKDTPNGDVTENEGGSIATRIRRFKKKRLPQRFENFYTKEIPKLIGGVKRTVLGSKIRGRPRGVRKVGRPPKRLLNKSDEEMTCLNPFIKKIKTCSFCCNNCGALYQHKASLVRHQKFECGIEPQFSCALCDYRGKHKGSLKKHIINIHLPPAPDVKVEKDIPLLPKQQKRPGRKPLNLNRSI